MKRRTFSREFKLAAVNKVVVQGLSYTEVDRDLGIRHTVILKPRGMWEESYVFYLRHCIH